MSEQGDKVIPLTRIQKLIGQRMLESKQNQPCFYMTAKANVDEINKTRRPLSKELGVRISLNDFLIRAMALAAAKFPLMAAKFKDGQIENPDSINIGLAVAAPVGLVVPIIKDANNKSLIDVARQTAELIEKARNNKLTLADLSDTCITLTALGMFGIDSFLAIPSPGQCSILSVGKIFDLLAICDGQVVTNKYVEFGLSADARIVTADYAAQFLTEITNLLSNPQKLID